MKTEKKYKTLKIILYLNPIPITVFFIGIATILIAQIKFIKRKFTMSWWLKTLPIIFISAIFEILLFALIASLLSSYEFLYYIGLKVIDVLLGYFLISKLEKNDLFTFNKVEY